MKTPTLVLGVVPLSIAAASAIGPSYAENKPKVVEPARFIDPQQAAWQPCEGLPGCEFVPLRGDATKEASEALFRLAAGVRFPKHWHTSPEHILVVQGELNMSLANGERYSIGPRMFLYNPSGMIHWGNCGAKEACVYYVYDDQPYDVHLVE